MQAELKLCVMKKFFKSNWNYILGGLLAVALFFIRFYHLILFPIFADEAIYVRWAQVMKAEETLRFLPLSDGKEPLFMWVVIPFLKVIHNPLLAARVVSVLSGFGTMLGVGVLSYLLFKNKRAALAAAVIYAVSPFTFFFDRMALVDSMLSMFGVWTFIFAYLAYTKERWDLAMLAGFTLGGAWLTKSPALFFALMLPTLWLFASWKKGLKRVIKKVIKLFGLTIPMVTIGYGMYNILRLGPNYSMIAKRNLDYVWPISHILTSPFDPLLPFLNRSLQWLEMMGPWMILILAIFGLLVSYKKYWKELLVLSIWFLAPIVVQSEYAKVLTARYILFSLPFLIIIAASSFNVIKKSWLNLAVFALAFFVAQSAVFDYSLLTNPNKANLPRSERSGYLEEWSAGQGIKETADYILSEHSKNPSEKIVVGTEGYFGTLPDGLEIYLNNIPNVTVIGVGLNFDDMPKPLVDSRKSGNQTYLLVNQSRFHYSPSKYNLEVVAKFPKAIDPSGNQDYLLLMKLP